MIENHIYYYLDSQHFLALIDIMVTCYVPYECPLCTSHCVVFVFPLIPHNQLISRHVEELKSLNKHVQYFVYTVCGHYKEGKCVPGSIMSVNEPWA